MHINKTVIALIPFILLSALISCGGGGSTSPAIHEPFGDYTLASSDKERDRSPNVAGSDLGTLENGNTEFALDLYKAIKDKNDNIFYSPYSISIALAMTYAGARGDTETQMADAMDYYLPQDKLHPAFNALDLELASRGSKVSPDKRFKLNIANSLWGEKTWNFLPAFLDTLAENYGAGLRLVDFAGAPDDARVVINDWVDTMTEHKIPKLLDEGTVNSMTVLILVNAIYFNAQWKTAFVEEATEPGTFNLLDGGKVTVPMMSLSEENDYYEGDGFQTVKLPYTGDELSMLVILPDSGKFDEFENSFDASGLDEIDNGLKNVEVNLKMPKFEYDMGMNLNDTLSAMGMVDAFIPDLADFSGMDGTKMLYIQWVIHKAYVKVDEAGTEAAAATAVGMGYTSAPAETVDFVIDRPFIFMIRDDKTGTVLFVGRVLNPS